MARLAPPTKAIHVATVGGAAVRYIDQLIHRRYDEDADGVYDESGSEPLHYYLTDVQFSTVAIIDKSANVAEWLSYDSYGEAQHHRLGDLDGDGVVNSADLSNLLTNWGSCPGCAADLDRDGVVDANDQSQVLASWGWASKGKLTEIAAGGGASGGGGGNIFGYANYVFNAEVGTGGIYTVRFRHYDVGIGRWLERDPAGYIDGMNLYENVASEPLTGVDAFGGSQAAAIDADSVSESWVEALIHGTGRPEL